MTLQARGFRWSIGIHGLIILAVIILRSSPGSQTRVAVIDFTLRDNMTSSVAQHEPPPQRKEPQRKAERPIPRPREEVIKQNVPRPEEHQPLPSQVSLRGKEISASELPEAERSAPAPAAGEAQTAKVADTTHSLTDAGSASSGDTGGTAEQARATYLKEHFAYIRDRITKSISYPYAARKRGWHGRVKIAFVICEDGGVIDVRVIDSCGFSVLDQSALDTVKNVAPFPRPPVRAEIRMAISYRLN